MSSFSKDEFWKSFDLGIELDISGSFIYNGIRSFHYMKDFSNVAEIFEFLYNISAGIERLAKITIILTEHEITTKQDSFEKGLITHSHMQLFTRIKTKHKINLSPVHNKFLQLLTDFYKSMRYDRYNLGEVLDHEKEKNALIGFISAELNIEFNREFLFETKNDDRIKIFLGNVIGKLSYTLFNIIKKEAHRLNVYTYEMRYDSKAAIIFYGEEFNFLNETVVKRELLIFLMLATQDAGIIEFIRSLKPLDLDQGMINLFIKSFENPLIANQMYELIRLAYKDEAIDVNERIESLKSLSRRRW